MLNQAYYTLVCMKNPHCLNTGKTHEERNERKRGTRAAKHAAKDNGKRMHSGADLYAGRACDSQEVVRTS